ncbi:MAG TPA: type II toxin-antitoxin system HicB family antitoxin [Thermoanaerobacterales bacterium]|jgi:antitoxin HicB|nr:type II toxin-antitoxin system HicB family antitoxin [Thermoanaerobacterales bacterium]
MSEINKIDINDYKVEIIKLSNNDGGGFLATVPKLPGCMSDGETPEEALVNVKDAIKCWIETARELGRKVPEPDKYKVEDDFSGKLTLRMPKLLHKMIAEQAEKEGCSINQLIITYISMGIGNEFGRNQISVSFDGDYPLFDKLIKNPWDEYRKLNQGNRGSSFNIENPGFKAL